MEYSEYPEVQHPLCYYNQISSSTFVHIVITCLFKRIMITVLLLYDVRWVFEL